MKTTRENWGLMATYARLLDGVDGALYPRNGRDVRALQGVLDGGMPPADDYEGFGRLNAASKRRAS